MGKRYAWEDEEYTKKIIYMRKMKNSEPVPKSKTFWRLPLTFSIICYVLMLFRTPVCSLLCSFEKEHVAAYIKNELYSNVSYLLFLLLIPAVCLLLYIKKLIETPIREKSELLRIIDLPDAEERRKIYLNKYKLYTERKSLGWQTHVFFYVLLAIELTLVAQGIFFSSSLRETALLYSDLSLLRSGNVSIYEGKFLPTDRPLHNTYGYVIVPDKDYYYFSTDIGTFRCVKRNLISNELMQSSYRVEYLPGTYTVVSITNTDGVILTGTDGSIIPDIPEGYWIYGDMIIKSCTEVYGYDLLTKEGQMAFDLIYGEYYSSAVALGDESTHSFYLPEPITKDEYRRVLSLYNAATYHRKGRQPWRYDTNDTDPIKKIYAGGIISDTNSQYFEMQSKASEIAAAIPLNLSEIEKCYYLSQYLVKHVVYYSDERPNTTYQDSNGVTITISTPDPEWSTAYGALIEGHANCEGFSSAFAALCYEAGINCICIFGETPIGSHSWNMVYINGYWYNIDITWMNAGGKIDETYFMADDSQIAASHYPVSYGGCEFAVVPISGPPEHSWLYTEGRAFSDAQSTLTYLQNHLPESGEFYCIRLDNEVEFRTFIECIEEAGENLEALVYYGIWGYEPVIRIHRRE